MAASLNQFFLLYMWFPLVALLVFAYLIARFFERFSSERTFAPLFLVPVVTFGAALVRYATIDGIARDVPADLLFGISGLLVAVMALRLLWLMMYRRHKNHRNGAES
ncbi:MAG: hypothetical protein EA396_05845 [Anaerolineaceae bacterium]|nr:MAG: hypothetical protein EA396_05845 [Anaerolineaceae bacterium]